MSNIHYDVPSFGNPSGLNCFQSVIKMALAYFELGKEFSWDELDRITGRKPHMATWPMAAMIWLKTRGYDVQVIELFDYQAVVSHGADYLVQEFGEEPAKWMIEHSDMPAEQKRAKQMLKVISVEKRAPTAGDIKRLLDEGYLVHTTVNSRRLNGRDGYVGHALLHVGYDTDGFFVNDPGGGKVEPKQKGRHIRFDDFQACWADPNISALNILAFKPKVK